MKPIGLLIAALVSFSAAGEPVFEKKQAILDPEKSMKKILDGNTRLQRDADPIQNLPRPWTVENLIALHNDPKYASRRSDIIWILAASRDERGKELVGKYIEKIETNDTKENLDLRMEAVEAVVGYYCMTYRGGGTEQAIAAADKWWKEYKRAKRDQASEKWQASWDNTENKDGLDIETTKAIAGRLASGDMNEVGKSIGDLKARRAVSTLIKLLDYPNDLILKETAGALVSFPTKEVAMALFTKLKELDSALAGGTHGIAAQEQAVSVVAKSLFRLAKIEESSDFTEHEKRNQVIESALGRMVPEK